MVLCVVYSLLTDYSKMSLFRSSKLLRKASVQSLVRSVASQQHRRGLQTSTADMAGKVESVTIIGSGLMGSGIAQASFTSVLNSVGKPKINCC